MFNFNLNYDHINVYNLDILCIFINKLYLNTFAPSLIIVIYIYIVCLIILMEHTNYHLSIL